MICYDQTTNLPTVQMWKSTTNLHNKATNINGLQACITSSQNLNLTAGQKELLRWHYKLCHTGIDGLQSLLQTGTLGQSPLI